MSDLKESRQKQMRTRRPVASASINAVFEERGITPEIAQQMISEIAVALLKHVVERMRMLSIDNSAFAEGVAPTLRLINEVSEEINLYRAAVERY